MTPNSSKMSFNRLIFISVLLFTFSLTVWKSSALHTDIYQQFEWYFGGSMILHATLSFLIGFFAAAAIPNKKTANSDPLGFKLLILLLFLISLEELSQIFIANRSFSLADLSINWIGLASGYFIRKLFLAFRS